MTAQEYELTPAGVMCRIMRACRRAVPESGGSLDDVPWTWEWLAHLDGSVAFSLSWDSERRRPESHQVVTSASFPFDPDEAGDEADALERARRYCVEVATIVAGMRPALEGLVARAEAGIRESSLEHRAIMTKIG